MRVIFVSGAVANKPLNGGAAWTRLSWALGLKRMGFDVYFVEQIARRTCRDGEGRPAAFAESLNLRFFDSVMAAFGLRGAAALIDEDGQEVHGLTWAELLEAAEAADLLVNLSGHLSSEPLMSRLRRRAFIDLDPGFTQAWHSAGNQGARLAGHDFLFTVAENIHSRECLIPTGDFRWRPTRQPVVLEHWPVVGAGARERFTTVASWRGPFGPVEHAGRRLGLKLHEFRRFIDLPEQATQSFEIALDIHAADESDREALRRHGWRLVDPKRVAATPEAFRRYVQRSGAEFSAAQGIYVESRSGWFSDRTTRYLASGKPALVQDTGFTRQLPVGDGLLAFRNLHEATAGAAAIAADPERHGRAARALAEAYFDSDKVLERLLQDVGVSP